MRILFTSRQFHPCVGGTEIFMLALAKRLVQRGHEVGVVAQDTDLFSKKKLPPYEEYLGIRIHRIPSLNAGLKPIPTCSPAALYRIFSRYDLVHSHDIRFLLEYSFLFKALLKKPLVIGSYGYIFHQKKNERIKDLVFRNYLKPALGFADRILAISRQDFDKVKDRYREPMHEILEGGIEYRKYSGVERAPVPGRLLYFGRLDRHKGVDLLFRALAKVEAPHHLHLVYGSSNADYLRELQALSLELGLQGRLHWLGFRDDAALLRELAEARFVMLPSTYEGFGLTTIEAMAAGAPPVANRIDAFENVVEDGKTGFLTPFADADAAAKRITQLLSLSPTELDAYSQAARSAAAKYDWERKVDRLERIYEEVLSRPKGAEKPSASAANSR